MRIRTRGRRSDHGAAIVELPAVFIAIAVFALLLTALAQVFLDYHHVTGAARAGARFATKSDYDPTLTPGSSSRRPTAEEVVAFTQQAAAPLDPVDVELAADDVAGTGLTVVVRHQVGGGAYDLVTQTANGFLTLLTLDPLPPVTVRATSTALYE